MLSSSNKLIYPGYGGKYDLRMTLRDYIEFTDTVRQHDISNAALLKFKHLYRYNGTAAFCVLVAPLVPGYAFMAFLRGRVNRGSADLKWAFPAVLTGYVVAVWFMSSKEIPRRLYTELLTDEGDDGRVLRRGLRDKKPNLWRHLSSQMHRLGYSFPEMNEHNSTHIPGAMV